MAADAGGDDQIRRLEEQYRSNPDSLAFARLADAHRKAGEPDRAMRLLEEGIRRHPDYPSAHIVRARALVDMGRHEEAEAALRRVLELDAQNLVAMRGLASLAESRDDTEEAVAWFERIAALDPLNVEAEAALERLRHRLPATPPAHDPLPAPIEEFWSSPPTEEPGVAPEAAPPESASHSEAWWFEDPRDDEAGEDGDLLTRTMAELYAQQGLKAEAAAIYRELLVDHPEDEKLRQALEALERESLPADPASAREPSRSVDLDAPTEDLNAGTADLDAGPADLDAGPEDLDAGPENADGGGRSTGEQARPAGLADEEFRTHPVPEGVSAAEVYERWLQRLSG